MRGYCYVLRIAEVIFGCAGFGSFFVAGPGLIPGVLVGAWFVLHFIADAACKR